jgi:hypothetical protein
MLAMVISINGEQVVTAGVEDWGLLHTDLMAKRVADTTDCECEITNGGLPKQPSRRRKASWSTFAGAGYPSRSAMK